MDTRGLQNFSRGILNKNFLFLGFFILLSCNAKIDSDYIEKQTWQHDSGYNMTKGDFLEFGEQIQLKGDSIMINGSCLGIIVSENRSNNELEIIEPHSHEKGLYLNIKEFTK